MPEGQPAFQGTADEQRIAEQLLGLMIMQGRAYAADAPIRQSLHNFSTFFLERGLRPTREEVAELIEAAVRANSHIFYRQETDGEVVYVTSRRGQAVRPLQQTPVRYIPPASVSAAAGSREAAPSAGPRVSPAMSGIAGRPATSAETAMGEAAVPRPRPVLKPTLLRREVPVVTEARPARREVRREPKPVPVVKRPQVTTPDGEVIYMDRPPEEILEAHGGYFQSLLAEKLVLDSRFVSFGQEWLLAEMLVDFKKSDLRRMREAIDESRDALPDHTFLTDLLEKKPEDEDYERTRFSLNYVLAREKRDFEFRGTHQDRYWGTVGMASPRPSRSPLRPSEIGQDFKFLEDEPPRTSEGVGRWIHALTFYEIEHGLLPYSATAKLVLPRPVLKDQRIAQLEFRAPQLNLGVIGELHFPSGNRGGWVDGLEDILDNFIPGARLIVEGTERDSVFVISYRRIEPTELETVRYDEKKGRFGFVTIEVNYQVDETMLVTRPRFKNLGGARRLDENGRRKGDQVIAFAFTKVGTRSMESEEKAVFRASLSDLLPVVNLDKPFSRASLLRFMATHPHYGKDETEDGYYLYRPEE